MPLVVAGRVAPMHPAEPQASFVGRVYLDDDGTVSEVSTSAQPGPAGFDTAPEVDVANAFIYPGLIDLHSHLGYASLPLWTEPTQETPFRHHNDWTDEPSYKPSITWPSYLLAAGAPEALLVYAQVRALAGGTTAIQGWPTMNRNPVNDLVRSVDDEDLGTGDRNLIRTSALTLGGDELASRAGHLEDGEGFIYHCAEGRPGSVVTQEFDDVATANCLRERLIAVHLNAVGEEAFQRWDQRARLAGDPGPGAVVWSPFSNLWLYGTTTDLLAARGHNVTVCLGSDWGPSGTKNLLGELKVARLWSEQENLGLTAFELAQMVTSSPGDALARCWSKQVGRLMPGALADVAVMLARHADPWENLVTAREEDVLLVIVGGRARYGTKALMDRCGVTLTTSVGIGSQARRVQLVDPDQPDRRWYWSRALDALEAVRRDPAGAMAIGLDRLAAAARVPPGAATTADPLVLELDMPGPGGVAAGPPPDPSTVVIPKAPSLRHDLTWRASVRGRGFHQGLLDGMSRFYD
jgi:5-methylthioadenosine/S-adenosylhomocysteine deaminase